MALDDEGIERNGINGFIKGNYKKHKPLIHNLFWRSLQIFFKQGISFLIFIISAKLLMPYEFGLYSYILGFAYILVFLGDFGISSATSKFVAEYRAKNPEKLKSVLFNSSIIILSTTLIILAAALIFGRIYAPDKYLYLLYLLPLIIFSPLTSLYDGIYRGLKRFKSLAVISVTTGIVSLCFVYLLISSYGLAGAMISQSAFYFLLFLALAIGYRDFNFKLNTKIMKEIGKYSLIIGLGFLGVILYSKIDVIFLGHFGFIEEAGYYEIANKLLIVLIIPFAILGQIIAPDMTRYFTEKNYSKIMGKFKKYVLLSVAASAVLTLFIFLCSQYGISLFLDNYNNPKMLTILSFMLAVYFMEMINALLTQGFVIPTGFARINTALLISFGIIHVFLNYILMSSFGFMGIIYSVAITKVSKDLLYLGIYYSVLKKNFK